MNDFSRDITNLKNEDFSDGWALTKVSNYLNHGQIEFYAKEPDVRFFVPNKTSTFYQTKQLQIQVPVEFLDQHETEILSGIKPTLLSLLDVDTMKFFRVIPLNLVLDKDFYQQYVSKAIAILKKDHDVDGIKELTYKTQEKSNLLKFNKKAMKEKRH